MDLAPVYGISLDDCDPEAAIGPFFAALMGGKPVLGDQIQWRGFVWTVAAMDSGQVRKLGLRLASAKA